MQKALETLYPEKSVYFHSPIDPSCSLVRTGVPGVGVNTFFHAILRATKSEYSSSDAQKRDEMAQRLRSKIVKPTKREIVPHFKDATSSESALNTVIRDIVDLEILAKLFEKYDTEYNSLDPVLSKLKKKTFSEAKKVLEGVPNEKVERVCEGIEKALYTSLKKAYSSKNDNLEFTGSLVKTTAKYIDRDIYFLNEDRLPMPVPGYTPLGSRKTIILLYFSNSQQFEIVGKLYLASKVDREFSPDDEMVKCAFDCTMNLEEAREKYEAIDDKVREIEKRSKSSLKKAKKASPSYSASSSAKSSSSLAKSSSSSSSSSSN